MAMYRDLLVSSYGLGVPSDEASDPTALLVHLLECRRRLLEASAGDGPDVSRDVALNIDYDLALLRLCVATDIACDPRRFDHPLVERRRLEHELEASGFDLAALGTRC